MCCQNLIIFRKRKKMIKMGVWGCFFLDGSPPGPPMGVRRRPGWVWRPPDCISAAQCLPSSHNTLKLVFRVPQFPLSLGGQNFPRCQQALECWLNFKLYKVHLLSFCLMFSGLEVFLDISRPSLSHGVLWHKALKW